MRYCANCSAPHQTRWLREFGALKTRCHTLICDNNRSILLFFILWLKVELNFFSDLQLSFESTWNSIEVLTLRNKTFLTWWVNYTRTYSCTCTRTWDPDWLIWWSSSGFGHYCLSAREELSGILLWNITCKYAFSFAHSWDEPFVVLLQATNTDRFHWLNAMIDAFSLLRQKKIGVILCISVSSFWVHETLQISCVFIFVRSKVLLT